MVLRTLLRSFETNRTGELVTRLDHGLRGRSLKLGDLDSCVQDYIRKPCLSREVVNRSIVIAAARGIIEHNKPSLLCEHGGTLQLGKIWADSLLNQMRFVKQKATKAAGQVPMDFSQYSSGIESMFNQVVC